MTPPKRPSRTPLVAFLSAAMAALPLLSAAAPTDIHNEPLANAAAAPPPNVMFILDDSGSMMWQHSPDYTTDYEMFNTNGTVASAAKYPICFDYKDNDNTISTTPDNASAADAGLKSCALGDPPLMSAQYNKQYYDPTIRYRPAINHDGTERMSMTAANTANWTAVPTDAYGLQNRDQIQTERHRLTSSSTTATTNLVTGYPDRLWCTDTAAQSSSKDDAAGTKTGTPNAPLCVKNSAYSYPNNVYGYGRNQGTTTTKFVFGNPYYYTIPVSEYCTTANLVDCVDANADGSNPSPVTHTFAARMRWCSDSGSTTAGVNAFSNCQGKRTNTHTYPKAFGRVISSTGTPLAKAAALLTVSTGLDNVKFTITSLTIDGVNILSSATSYASNNVVKTAGSTEINANDGLDTSNERNSMAQAIVDAINGISGTTGYSASRSGSVVRIEATTAGSAPNGRLPIVGATIVSTAAAKATIKIESVSSTSSITNLTANGAPLIGGTVSCNYSNNATNRNNCASNLTSAINAYTGTSGYSALRDGSAVTVTAPLAAGATANGRRLVETGSVATDADAQNSEYQEFKDGASNSALPHTVTAFSGGSEYEPSLAPTRVGVVPFARIDIVSGPGRTYPKTSERSDCSTEGYCTYEEEMTNFANWYAYYRTRMQMMKTATGRAFAPLPETYRIGFITINPGATVSSSRYLRIDDFTTGAGNQRDKWYGKLYAQTNNGGTPLREALSRVGQLYAGKFGSGFLTKGIPETDDPIQLSCQSNFAILSTDGYWNNEGGRDLSNKALGDVDGVEDDNYSKSQDGVYDEEKASNTLSDAALYYYQTDLRPDIENNVRQSTRDSAQHQHMTTFTLGLGLDGTLTYDRNYETQQSGDFHDIRTGDRSWPIPVAEQPSALDDLWHAAVSGRGKFFSASDPQELALGLQDTLTALQATPGAGAAAATSNLQPVSGDNFAFTAEYRTVEWSGDLKARTIDLSNGNVSSVVLWSARERLDQKAWNTRRIYTYDAGDDSTGGNRMKSFCWPGSTDAACADGSGLSAAEQAHFNPTLLIQYPSLTATQQEAMTGQKIVDYIRGDRANEMAGTSTITDLFRERTSALGDFVSAQPRYVRASDFSYADANYAAFRICTAGYGGPAETQPACGAGDFPRFPKPRRGTVFAAANDGMLHAFETDVNNDPYYQTAGISTPETSDDTFTGDNAGNGEERWAYIPSTVLPNLAKLAESPYTHRYFVDGSPQVGDICKGACATVADWRTILVGGLNAGGRGYYALDITNPESPKALWEFTVSSTCLSDAQAASGLYDADCHLGYTYGNPLITKRKADGKWLVIVASGHNNFNPGDGKGYLYVLDAYTGKILKRIGTGAGSAGTASDHADANPAGLAKINGWADNSAVNNTTLAVYGGDLLGNLWKFELDDERSGYLTAIKLATLTDAGGAAQPVTTRPELAYVNGYRAVYVATGKYLGLDDPGSTAQQTVYAIRDDLSGATVDARTETVARTLGSGSLPATRRVTDNNGISWAAQKGWRVDLPDTGERVNVDPLLQLGTLTVASNVPNVDVCTSGGYSYLNFFNIVDGGSITVVNTLLSSVKLADALVVGVNIIQLPGGVVKAIVTTAANQQLTKDNPTPAASFTGRRVSWRELLHEH